MLREELSRPVGEVGERVCTPRAKGWIFSQEKKVNERYAFTKHT